MEKETGVYVISNKAKNLMTQASKAAGAVGASHLEANKERVRALEDSVRSKLERIKNSSARPVELQNSSALIDFQRSGSSKLDKTDNKSKVTRKNITNFLTNEGSAAANSFISSNLSTAMLIKNYKAIYDLIPQMAQVADLYRDNITSPDDFTKTVFSLIYDVDDNANEKETIEARLEELRNKYDATNISDKLINKALISGKAYVNIINIKKELENTLRSNPNLANGILTESSDGNFLLEDSANIDRICSYKNSIDPVIYKSEMAILENACKPNSSTSKNLTEDDSPYVSLPSRIVHDLQQVVNENIIISTSATLHKERLLVEAHNSDNIAHTLLTEATKPDRTSKVSPKKPNSSKNKVNDQNILYNNSSVAILDEERVVKLTTGNICYGYLYIDTGYSSGAGADSSYLGPVTPSYGAINPLTSQNPNAAEEFANDQLDNAKQVFANVILRSVGAKIDLPFIEHNPEFREAVFELINQKYITDKKVKMVFMPPEEVVEFKTPSIYTKSVFFSKLYIASLMNTLLIKMSRGHDKRVVYVETNIDADYEQAVSETISNLKTKEINMGTMTDINTMLNIDFGAFDDYYIPMNNGERPFEIDTLAGMDAELINNDFMEFLLDAMISGTGAPASVSASMGEVDYARRLSQQNANFLRYVIKRQVDLTPSFSEMYRMLYRNEFCASTNKNDDAAHPVDVDAIFAKFNSPATLNMDNTEQLLNAATNIAGIIADTLVGDSDVDADKKKHAIKSKVVQDYVKNIDWEDINKVLTEDYRIKESLEKEKNAGKAEDAAGGGYGGY